MTEYLTSEIAEEKQTIAETVEINGDEYRVDYKEATLDEAAELEQREEAGEDERELFEDAIGDYVAKPATLDVGNLPMSTLQALMRGMYRAWGIADDDIDEMLEDRSGN